MNRLVLNIFFLISFISLNAQFCQRDEIEKECHYPIENKEELFKRVDTFLYLMSKQDSNSVSWIDEEDLKLWITPFDEISFYITKPKWRPKIVGILDEAPNLYSIKLLFNHSDSTKNLFLGVYTLYLKFNPKQQKYKFKDYRTIHIEKRYDTFKIGNIIYYAQNIGKLEKKNCIAFNIYNTQVAKLFGVKPKKINYFFMKNSTELLNFFGWDVVYNMFYGTTGGFARFGGKGAKFENQIYSGNNSERYDHELIHLYYNELLNSDTAKSTLIIGEGLPTYFGGSSGKSYKELKQTLKLYLDKTDSVKIKNHFVDRSVNIQIDKYTNYIYAMGAFITEIYFKKEGLKGLQKLANYDDGNFINNLCKDFKIKEDELDNYLRNKIKSF